jgi:hypothetical protein
MLFDLDDAKWNNVAQALTMPTAPESTSSLGEPAVYLSSYPGILFYIPIILVWVSCFAAARRLSPPQRPAAESHPFFRVQVEYLEGGMKGFIDVQGEGAVLAPEEW